MDDNQTICAKYFKKRICTCFVRNNKNSLCIGCQRPEGSHFKKNEDPDFQWNYRDCTNLSPTDAYGVLNFPGSHSKSAKYIRIEVETQATDMLRYMLDFKGWNLQPPRLLLSVTGGAKKFNIPSQMRQAFKRGLVKVATTTGAWIITGGTNTGVMKLVGEAVSEEFYNIKGSKIAVLGIATWGQIALRDMLIRKKRKSIHGGIIKQNSIDSDEQESEIFYAKNINHSNEETDLFKYSKKFPIPSNNEVFLDPNHTHFILVDDGSVGSFGKEIEFRTRLETELRKQKINNFQKELEESCNVPMLLIVVQGGPNTLVTVENTIIQKIQILVLAESKGCAEIISRAYFAKENINSYKKIVEESNFLEKYKDTPEYDKKVDETVNRLRNILIHKQYINVFSLEKEQDIEMAILRAFLELNKNQHFENFKLALDWNRYDVADSYIFTGEEDFRPEQLAFLMETALVQNKPKFVKILLDNGLDLKSFLTVKRLLFLYNSQNINLLGRKAPLFRLFKRKYLPQKNLPIITFEGIIKFLKGILYQDFKPNFLVDLEKFLDLDQVAYFLKNASMIRSSNFSWLEMDEEKFLTKVKYPEKNLFVWAILMNRMDIANIFWHLGDYQIATALFACNLQKVFSQNLTDFDEEFREHATYFEDIACSVFEICDDLSIDFVNSIILLQKIPYYNVNCLQMAYEAKCLKFISLPSVQNLLTDIWHGKMEIKSGIKASLKLLVGILSLGTLAPFLMFNNKTRLPKPSNFDDIFKDLNISNVKKLKIAKVLDKYFINDDIYLNKNDPSFQNLKKKFGSNSASNDIEANESSDSESDDDQSEEDEEGFAEENFFGHNDTNKIEAFSIENNGIHTLTYFQLYWKRYRHFIDSPRVHFIYETIFYLIFLILFSYMLLCDFQYSEMVNFSYNSTNTSSEIFSSLQIKYPGHSELLVIIWVSMYLLEEFRQFSFLFNAKELKYKIKGYFNDNWNFIDLFGCFIFFIGLLFRIISVFSSEIYFKVARVFYAIDLTIWYLRLLHVAIIFKPLGPKLVMIKKMIYDLMFFLIVIIIFVLPFGITTQATMYPEQKIGFNILITMINKAYWPIYGEMKILDEITEEDEENVPDSIGKYYSFIALMIYMIIANVLLLNLLIAMFSSTYELIQVKADQIWKFQRYRLVFDYYDSSVFTPPFSPFALLSSVIQSYIEKRKVLNNENDFESETLNLEKIFSEEYHRKCQLLKKKN